VLETDSPYLAPVPFRGKRNQPGNLKHIVDRIAELKNNSFDDIVESTSANAKKIFPF
jgi:TatD DNase family protein